jgi:hypothetical protein
LEFVYPSYIFRCEIIEFEVNMKNILIFLLFVFALSCRETPADLSNQNIDQPFLLRVGENVNIKPYNLQLCFDSVLSDSRCPTGVVCFWEGEAKIKLWLMKSGSHKIFTNLTISGYVEINDSLRHQYVDTLGYRIKLMQLDPYPCHPIPNDFSKYRATLNVSKIR